MALLRNLRIRTKLFSMLLGIAAPSVAMMAWLGYSTGRQALEQEAFDQLTAIRTTKAYQIEKHFRDLENEVRAVANGPRILEAMRRLPAVVRQLGQMRISEEDAELHQDALREFYAEQFLPRLGGRTPGERTLDDYWPTDATARYLQYHYIASNPNPIGRKQDLDSAADGSNYSHVHATLQPVFRAFVADFGYYDLFLIDATSGRIVYTVFKETDFGTNLLSGPYRDSGLARAFTITRDSSDPDAVVLIDFDRYDPSFARPEAFLAAQIRHEGQLIGVLALQISSDEIERIMTGGRNWRADGLGETGETYLVGADHKMRSVSRFLIEDRENYFGMLREIGTSAEDIALIESYDTSILIQEVRTGATQAALAGRSGTSVIDDYRGVSVLSSYAPVDIAGVEWVIASEVDAAEAFAPIDEFRRRALYAFLAMIAAVGIVAAFGTRIFVRPIDALVAGAEAVGRGDLEVRVTVDSRDEFGVLAGTFNRMVDNIREKTEEIAEKNRQNEELLLNILPGPVAERLKSGEEPIADSFPAVTVLFADLVGFTEMAGAMEPEQLVGVLNDLFTGFDELAGKLGIEKIKTIGDAYMAVCGLPEPHPDHARAMAEMALGMLASMRRFNEDHRTDLAVRIGINTGPVVAGIIGARKFIYDLWGDTVNLASRMESHGLPDTIQVSESTWAQLREHYRLSERGEIEIKGKGRLRTWLLEGRV